MLAIGIVAIGVYQVTARELSTTIKMGGTEGPITVTGDSTTYYLWDYLLPSPTHDSTYESWGDSTRYTAYYDTVTFDVRSCDGISVYGAWDGDSVYYWVDYSIDGLTWTNWTDSTLVNGTPGTTFPPTRTRWSQKFYAQKVHMATSGINNTVHFGDFGYPWLRFRLRNEDRAKVNVGDSSLVASTAADTAFNVQLRVICAE